MTDIVTTLLMAFVWSILAGELTFFNLAVGSLIGLLLLGVIQRGKSGSLPRRLFSLALFIVRFVVELIQANFAIALLAIIRNPKFHPHIIAVPLRIESDAAIALLASTITLLPGTVALGVSEDKSLMYAHAIGEADLDKARDSVTRIETLILGFMK